eukprot:CCRYP_014943-RA/>CCRYP_014943-RA protein AED:0.27 eAED:0.27 QI:197/1/1/1/1/1/3/0/1278
MTENDLSQNNDDDEWSRLVQGLLSRSVPSLPTGNKDGVHETDIDNSLKHTSMMISKYDGQSSSLPSCTLRSQTVAARTNTSSPTHNIQTLPPDASSLILSHLHPHDLHSFSLTSHKGHEMFCSELLWRLKFLDRWNCYPDFDCCGDAESDWLTDKLPHMAVNRPSSARSFWRQAYIAAHNNTHDLWIRHWNCVYPEDVTTCPGRTVVPTIRVDYCGSDLARDHVGKEHENETKETEFEKNYNATSLRMCPTCRYHPMLQYPSGYNSDVFRAVRDELDFANQQNYNEDNVMEDDPVNKAEVVAAAHSLLAHKYSNSDASNLFHNCLQSTLARAIHYSSMYSIAKWCRNIRLRYEGSGGTIFDKNESGNLSLLEMFHDRLGRIEHGINISEPNQSANFHSWQQMIQNKAIYAFECASTYNRRISADQYNSSGLHFLTDALFFNIHPSHEKDRTSSQTWRSRIGCPDNESRHKFDSNSLDDLLHDLNQQNAHESSPYSLSELGAKFETSHHSWHIVRLTNPDYVRPIAFRAYIQCRDAFTVFPSQGYLKGGETIHLVLGVRTKGSLLNEALEAIDVEREEADPSFASLHSNKGHLPFVPFIIRYMFAPCVPCLPHDFTSRPDVQSRFPFAQVHQQQAHTDFHSVLDHLWDNVTAEADVRTIPISCHVNSNYSLDEFQNATLMPFDVSTRSPSVNPSSVPLTAVLPQLQHRSPQLFSMVQNLDIELEQSYVGDCYRTEKCCRQCKRDWGGQSESLGRAYILRRLEMERHALIRSRQQADFFRTLRAIPLMLQNFLIDDENLSRARLRGLSSLLNRVRQIIYIMQTDFLIQNRANRLVTNEERQLFSSCEIYLDATYSDLQQCIHIIEHSDEECKGIVKNWRNTGVYKNARCADWVIRAESAETDNLFKAELDHLQKFGLMEYNPGGFNLGRQDDPNHEEFRSYLGSQPSMHTDMFHNNAAKAFLSALAMIGKPECLIGHGVYDRVDKPGAVIRSPSYPLDVFFRATSHRRLDAELIRNAAFLSNQWASVSCSSGMSQSRYYKSWNSCIGWKKINFEMNDPDPDGLSIVTFALRDFATNFQTAMAHFICNIPLPGQGRHVLSSPMGDHERNCDIVSIYSRVQPYSKIIFPSIPGHLEVSQNAYMTSANTQVQPPRHGDAVPNGLLVQELNIVWLIARHLGWTVDDDQSRGAILVDRRVLIAVQWFSNTIMVFSLLASLLSRKFKLVKSIPADFHFFGGPTPVINNDMRYVTSWFNRERTIFLYRHINIYLDFFTFQILDRRRV